MDTGPHLKDVLIEPLGERAFILRNLGDSPAHAVATALMADAQILEAAPAYDTVGVFVGEDFEFWHLRELLDGLEITNVPEPKLHVIPVCYDYGPDLAEVAHRLSLKVSEVVRHHTKTEYTCFALGFSPGFPFLGYLSEAITGLPRRSSPRPKVEPGSVGITGRQTGIYPSATPGGWNLIGRTPLTLVDLEDRYFPISAGDRVRFEQITAEEFERRAGDRL